MSSILPNYEYDIFISYRQNDNKPATAGRRDGWVSHFVQALKDELEATLKNPVSIYFDENPHDGLLESHQVGASLEKKLNCLVFIPIISLTYCDTKCFAWEHEFLPFISMAKGDERGMNITLANGNVASRVLPVQIHDLDSEDQSVIEGELGGPLRSIKFIHQAAGVNRPLNKEDDQVREAGKILYNDQINKVANALKEIGTSIMRNSEGAGAEVKAAPIASAVAPGLANVPAKSSKMKLVYTLAAIVIMLLSYWAYTKYNSSSTAEIAGVTSENKIIAVLPFANTKPDPDTDYLGFAIANQIIGELDYNKALTVRPSSAIRKYDQKVFEVKVVADDLKVNYVLTGTYLMQADIIRLDIELIEAKSKNLIWRDKIEVDYHNAFELQDIVAKKVVDGLQVQFSQAELSRISKNISTNPLAYEYYLRGLAYPLTVEGNKLAIKMLTQSIVLDSGFAKVYTELGIRYRDLATIGEFNSIMFRKVEALHLKAIAINSELVTPLLKLSEYYTDTGQIEKAMEYTRRVLEINPNNAEAHFALGYIYRYAGMNEESILEGEKAVLLDPGNISFRTLSLTYFSLHKYDKAIKVLKSFPPSTWATGMLCHILIAQGEKEKALKIIDRILEKNPDSFWGLIHATNKAVMQGDTLKALALLQKRELLNLIDGEPLYYSAVDYAQLGDKDGCNRLIQQSLDAGFFNYPLMLNEPILEAMQSDPEFKKILAKVKAKHEAFKEKYF